MKTFVFALLPLLAIVWAGCTNVATFNYTDAQGTMAVFRKTSGKRKSVTVMPFLDQRGIEGQQTLSPAGDSGSFYWGLLPLMPFGFVEKVAPENSEDFVSLGRYHFDPANDLANAAVVSLKASNLFASVKRGADEADCDTDYAWYGTIKNSRYRGKMHTYFITYFFAPVLWTLGAPNGVSVNELSVRFEMVDRRSGKVVFAHDYNGSDYLVHWIYARYGQDCDLFARLMKDAMNKALLELNQNSQELL